MTMLERVEMAIREALEGRGVIVVNGGMELAIAAVKAMREPDESMLWKGWHNRNPPHTLAGLRASYEAMLDSILATQPQEQER